MRLPNGYGSITKLSGKRRKPWQVRITTGWETNSAGKEVPTRKIIGCYATRQEAIAALNDYHQNPYSIDSVSATFSDIYDKWSAEKFDKISKSNVNGYKASYKVCESLYKMPFKDIKTSHLQAVVDNCGKAYPTLRKLRVLFSQMYQYAMANDVVNKNYAEFIDIGKNTNESTRKPFTQAEIDRLWENVDRMEYIDTVLIMIYTGWRIGELIDLKIRDIDLNEMIMRGGLKTEAGKNRLVPIHPRILPLIKKWYDKGGETLIKGTNGQALNYGTYFDVYFKNICDQLQMEHKPHDCRHTFATLMDNAGANKLCIKRIMGHASSDITDKVYTHKDIEELRKAILLLK